MPCKAETILHEKCYKMVQNQFPQMARKVINLRSKCFSSLAILLKFHDFLPFFSQSLVSLTFQGLSGKCGGSVADDYSDWHFQDEKQMKPNRHSTTTANNTATQKTTHTATHTATYTATQTTTHIATQTTTHTTTHTATHTTTHTATQRATHTIIQTSLKELPKQTSEN